MADQTPTRTGTPRTAKTAERKTAATKRSTAAKRAATTRAANRGASARQTAERKVEHRAQTTARKVETKAAKAERRTERRVDSARANVTRYAETAVFVPVGAALTARDSAIATAQDLRTRFSTRTNVEHEIERFERRGKSELQQRRARVERELRNLRRDLDKTTARPRKSAELAVARVENVMQDRLLAGTQLATKVSERIARVA